jgi:hypothetical protein
MNEVMDLDLMMICKVDALYYGGAHPSPVNQRGF